MDKSKIEYLEFYKAELGNGKHCTKSFGLAVWQHQQAKVDELTRKLSAALGELNVTNKNLRDRFSAFQMVRQEADDLQKRVDAALEVLEKAKKLNSGNYLIGEFENVLKGPQSITFKAGDKVVNKSTEYLGTINEVSWISGNHMRLKGHDFCHVFVVDGFRHATQGEIAIGHRIDGAAN
ncbi:hypothetical protein [Acinetobacter pittii]|uniref:hypothetical protein n=1 Tax=Acinetobacter pittii TaxID=48296 RepID=UPI000F747E2B|nr:hypothetical protein [Acinetobacter pittii]MDX8157807.1 hypothetical protein [Acinetobacter pittii]RSO48432.1 hypothetical protein EA757_07035 [Acinetobacter pittii]RSO77822.1 hypothetical protein EA753_07945 [Acinetobacter pittii]HIN56150.1 hypothetical protein [Acinetobacter pittii]